MSRDDTTIQSAAEADCTGRVTIFCVIASRPRLPGIGLTRLRLDWIGASFTLAAVSLPADPNMPMPLTDMRIGRVLACA